MGEGGLVDLELESRQAGGLLQGARLGWLYCCVRSARPVKAWVWRMVSYYPGPALAMEDRVCEHLPPAAFHLAPPWCRILSQLIGL